MASPAPFPPHPPSSWPPHRLIPRRPQQQSPIPPRPPTATPAARSLPTSTPAVPPLSDPAVRAELAIHGYAMLAVFTFLFPTMAWLMRYGSGRHRKSQSQSQSQSQPRPRHAPPRRGLSPGIAMFLHAGSLAISSIVTALAACLVLVNGIPCPSTFHRIIGPAIVVALIAQVVFGAVTFLKTGRRPQRPQPRGELSPIVHWIRVAHNVVGPLIIFFGFIQVPLGINMLYPFFETPLAPMYIIYYVAMIWWSCVVVVCERRGIKDKEWRANLDSGGQGVGVDSAFVGGDMPEIEMVSGESSSSKLLGPSSGPVPSSSTSSSSAVGVPPRRPYHDHAPAAASSSSLAHPIHASSIVSPTTSSSATTSSAPQHHPPHLPPAHNPTHAAKVISHALSLASQQNLPRLTWSDLDTYVTQRGKLWVIGPGGLVLDVSSWISTHPGGHKVLIDALGCNVAVDFFNLPNFDKQRFRAYPSKPKPRAGIGPGVDGAFSPASTDWSCTSTSGICSEIDPETCSPSVAIVQHRVTADDWKHVLVARQTNVHSKSAIAKLAGMAVALVPEVTLGTFNKLEYRRYAMTSKTVLGGGGGSSSSGRHGQRAATTVQFTFTLLYPNETYLEEPTFFLPGHAIQLRLRLSRTSSSSSAAHINQPPFWVTRYFTPLSGNMTHFSIAVKLQPGGLMSTLLSSLDPSHHRQIHIRGPFGSPLMNPSRPLPMDSGTFDHVVLLTAGSGVVAAVQLVGWYFTQTYFDLRVRPGYRAPTATARGGATGKDLDVAEGDKVLIRYPMTGGWVWGTNVRTGVDGYIALHALVPWIGTGPKVTVCVGERGGVDRIVGRDVLESAAGAYPAQVRVEYFISSQQDVGRGGGREEVGATSNVTPGRMTRESVQQVLSSSGFLAALNTGRRACKVVICGPEGFVGACCEWVTELVDDAHVWVLPPHTYFQGSSTATAAAAGTSSLSRDIDTRFAHVASPSPPAALIPPRAPLAVGPGPITLARNASSRQVSFSPYSSPPQSSVGSPNVTSGSSVMVVGADGTRRMSSLAGLAMRRDRGSNMPEWLCVPSPVQAAGTLAAPVSQQQHSGVGSLPQEPEWEPERQPKGGTSSSSRFVGGSGGRWP